MSNNVSRYTRHCHYPVHINIAIAVLTFDINILVMHSLFSHCTSFLTQIGFLDHLSFFQHS